MKLVIQRVSHASVAVEGSPAGDIDEGGMSGQSHKESFHDFDDLMSA